MGYYGTVGQGVALSLSADGNTAVVGGPRDDAVDHVLGRFRPGERPVIDDALIKAAQAVLVWAHQGVEACMNRFNAGPAKGPE